MQQTVSNFAYTFVTIFLTDLPSPIFGSWEGSLMATTVVLVVTFFEKMPKALLIRNGKLRNFAHSFVTSFPTDLPS